MKPMKAWKSGYALLFVAVLAMLFVGQVEAVTIIDTTPGWDGINSIGFFGEPNFATWGQTFTTNATDTILDNFTFWLDDALNFDFVDFAAYVMAWDGSKATGSVLFQSAPLSTTNNGGQDGMEQFTLNTGGVGLAPNQQYVAFFSASNFFDSAEGAASMGFLGINVYAGGGFVFAGNGSNFSLLTQNNVWNTSFHEDVAFVVSLSSAGQPIPEPSTLLLVGTGLVGLAAYRRKRRG